MSIHLKRSDSVFYHIPKTGGQWVYYAMKNSGVALETRTENGSHDSFGDSFNKEFRNKRSFAFVREPVSFYESYWCYKKRIPYDNQVIIEGLEWNDDFLTFMEMVIRNKTPHVTNLYQKYIGNPMVLSFVGRQEKLTDHLVSILKALGEYFKEDKLRQVLPINERIKNVECPFELRSEIESLESKVMEKYYNGRVLHQASR